MSDDIDDVKVLEIKLEKVKILLEHLVAVNLYANGVAKEEIAKNLHVRRATVDAYLRGMKVDKQK